jgi:hypothetical protein
MEENVPIVLLHGLRKPIIGMHISHLQLPPGTGHANILDSAPHRPVRFLKKELGHKFARPIRKGAHICENRVTKATETVEKFKQEIQDRADTKSKRIKKRCEDIVLCKPSLVVTVPEMGAVKLRLSGGSRRVDRRTKAPRFGNLPVNPQSFVGLAVVNRKLISIPTSKITMTTKKQSTDRWLERAVAFELNPQSIIDHIMITLADRASLNGTVELVVPIREVGINTNKVQNSSREQGSKIRYDWAPKIGMIALIVILMKNARNAVEGKDDIADGVRKAHTNQPGASRNLIADGNTMNVRANTVQMGRKEGTKQKRFKHWSCGNREAVPGNRRSFLLLLFSRHFGCEKTSSAFMHFGTRAVTDLSLSLSFFFFFFRIEV